MGFLIYRQGKESRRMIESLLVTHWNTVNGTKVQVLLGIGKLRNMKDLPVRSYTKG